MEPKNNKTKTESIELSKKDLEIVNQIQQQLSQQSEELKAVAMFKPPPVKDQVLKTSRVLLSVKNLIKKYGNKTILKNLNFEVRTGEIVGILGENAAGKTTLFKCISHSTDCDGDIVIDGVKHTNAPDLGLLWVEAGMDSEISLRDNLKFYCELYDIPFVESQIRKILKQYNLEKAIDTTWKYLSTGQKRKSAIARSFLKTCALYLIDEPTSGLDFNAQNNFQRFLKEHASKSQSAYLVITHNYADLESLCDKILILDKGQILDFDTVDNISIKYLQGVLITLVLDNDKGNIEDITKLLAESEISYYINTTVDSRISTLYIKIRQSISEYTTILEFLKPYILRQKIERITLKTFVDLLLAGIVFKAVEVKT